LKKFIDWTINVIVVLACVALVGAYIIAGGGCQGGSGGSVQPPTRAQCDETYALAVSVCDVALTDPKQHTQCVVAAAAVKMACYIVSTPEPSGVTPAESTEVKSTTRADRWAEGLELMRQGKMTPAEFEAWVIGT